MPAAKTIAELAIALGLSEEKTKSVLFHATDFLMENVGDAAIDCGLYHVPQSVGPNRLLAAYQHLLWARYEEAIGETPEAAGPWVHIDHKGIHLSNKRLVTVEVP